MNPRLEEKPQTFAPYEPALDKVIKAYNDFHQQPIESVVETYIQNPFEHIALEQRFSNINLIFKEGELTKLYQIAAQYAIDIDKAMLEEKNISALGKGKIVFLTRLYSLDQSNQKLLNKYYQLARTLNISEVITLQNDPSSSQEAKPYAESMLFARAQGSPVAGRFLYRILSRKHNIKRELVALFEKELKQENYLSDLLLESVNRNDPFALRDLADILVEENNIEQAKFYCRKAIMLGNTDSLTKLAIIYANEKNDLQVLHYARCLSETTKSIPSDASSKVHAVLEPYIAENPMALFTETVPVELQYYGFIAITRQMTCNSQAIAQEGVQIFLKNFTTEFNNAIRKHPTEFIQLILAEPSYESIANLLEADIQQLVIQHMTTLAETLKAAPSETKENSNKPATPHFPTDVAYLVLENLSLFPSRRYLKTSFGQDKAITKTVLLRPGNTS